MVAIAQGALHSFRSTSSITIAGGVTDLFYQIVLITISEEKATAYSRQAFKAMPKTFLYAMGGAVGATLLGSAIGYSLEKAGLGQKTKTISSIAGSILGIYITHQIFQSDIVQGIPIMLGCFQIGHALFGEYRQDILANMP